MDAACCKVGIFSVNSTGKNAKISLSDVSLHPVCRGPDVVDLEYHLHQLRGQKELGLLAVQALDDVLLLHV